MKRPEFIFLNGNFVKYEDAKIHVLSTANKYAAIVYEGIRAYWNDEKRELFMFRHKDHIDRLLQSMKITRMENTYSYQDYKEITIELLKKNKLREDVHIRQQSFVLADNGSLTSTGPIGVMIAAMPLGRYYGEEKDGLNVCISSWRRIPDYALPPRVKCTANYGNNRLATIQAKEDGYDEAIILTDKGYVAESASSNLFIMKDSRPITPMTTDGILEGITRASIIELFREEHGLKVIERHIDRTELYTADEAFLCGSGVEITPIISVDRHKIENKSGISLTYKIIETYLSVVKGELPRYEKWLIPIYGA